MLASKVLYILKEQMIIGAAMQRISAFEHDLPGFFVIALHRNLFIVQRLKK